ncbi:MAG TPA: hypothetical protein VJR47_01420 [Stellaceae bacterium]|nr:hypothetical protein [Stellaceae bacterium]
MRDGIGATASKLYRLFGSDRNTRIAQQLIVVLLGVTVMGTVMDALFDAARIVRPVARVEALLGLHGTSGGGPAAPIFRGPGGN